MIGKAQQGHTPGSGDPAPLPIAVRRHWLVSEVERRLRGRGGYAGGPIVAAVSGGPDSTALLLCLKVIAEREAASGQRDGANPVIAGHVHHHLRDQADDEAEWVRTLCKQLGIDFHIEHVYPGDHPGNVAANARTQRYKALQTIAKQVGARHIALGHHGDDQLETMLMALGRGAGLEGLAGMAWRRELENNIALIRPLLAVRKSDCEQLCALAGIEPRVDPGNRDRSTVRGRLRADVLPVVEELWPDAPRRINATAESVNAASHVLNQHLQHVFGDATSRTWPRDDLQNEPVPIIAAGLRRALNTALPHEEHDAITQKHLVPAAEIIASAAREPKQFDLPGGWCIHVTARQVNITPDKD